MPRKTPVRVDGHLIEFTNLEKVMYPETGMTKGAVVDYYGQVASLLIRHAHGRPATIRRWVDGVGTASKPNDGFFHKNAGEGAPSWVHTYSVQHASSRHRYPLADDAATIAWLTQLAALEIHTPQWRFGARGITLNPDRLVIDLDPGEGVGITECAFVARMVRLWLNEHALQAYPVTSGSKGIHLYAPLDMTRTSAEVSALAHDCAREIEAQGPDLVVSDMAKRLRRGKVFIDWSQNNGAKTTIAPYSLRGRVRPMVACPRTWPELDDPGLRHLECDEVLARVSADGFQDPLPASGAPDRTEADRSEADRSERRSDPLERYRKRRHQDRTPEPSGNRLDVIGGAASDRRGLVFVIQEHHARRRHFDLRLERSGVLVSWALPKGVPTDPEHDHLAVRTEDHPLEYAEFEGTIPNGEYGAGSVRLWDRGSLRIHKWLDRDEIIVTLVGSKAGGLGGQRTFALIHNGPSDSDDRHWLIHLMARPPRVTSQTIPLSPMLPRAGTEDDIQGVNWRYEMKWDGARVICARNRGEVHLWSRNGSNLTPAFPELASELSSALRQDAVVDGEIIALDASGQPDFSLLQRRLNVDGGSTDGRSASVPVSLMLFDVLHIDGKDVLDAPYDERRRLLSDLVGASSFIHVPPASDVDAKSAMATSRSLGLEGVVAKSAPSSYRPGQRSSAWIKVKFTETHEVVIAGWLPATTGGELGSLVVAVPMIRSKEFTYAGRVGAAMTNSDRQALQSRLATLTRSTPAIANAPRDVQRRATWVEPVLVAEVSYSSLTERGTMRHPVWRGLRPDKSPWDIDARRPA